MLYNISVVPTVNNTVLCTLKYIRRTDLILNVFSTKHTHAHMHTHAHKTYTHMLIHSHTHTHTFTHTHTHTQERKEIFGGWYHRYMHLSNLRAMKLKDAYSLEGRRQWHPTPVLLPGKSHGWRSLVGCSPWGR